MRTVVLLLLLALSLMAQDAAEATLTGKLLARADKSLVLKTKDKEVRLVSKDEYIEAILADERLLDKELQAAGKWEVKDRRLDLSELYTLHDGRRHRIAYYCETCSIWASKPGLCVCCQQPVELREVPLEDP